MAARTDPAHGGPSAKLPCAFGPSTTLACAFLALLAGVLPTACRSTLPAESGGSIVVTSPPRDPAVPRTALVRLLARGSDGELLPQAVARIERTLASPEEVLASGNWIDAPATCRADAFGRIAVPVTWPEKDSLALELRSPDHVARWIWVEPPWGNEVDLGPIELERAGRIEGVVLDEYGEPLRGEPVVATIGDFLRGPDGTWVFARAAHTRAVGGRFVLRGVPQGEQEIEMRSRSLYARKRVAVREGSIAQATLQPSPPGGGTSVVVDLVYPGPDPLDFPPEHVRLIDPDGSELHGRAIKCFEDGDIRLRHEFVGVEPKSHRLVIEDPRFATWSREDVRPGERIRAELSGSCSLQITLRESDGSAPELQSPGTVILWRRWRRADGPHRYEAFTGSRFRLDGLLPGEWRLDVQVPRHRDADVRLEPLAPHESRELEVVLERQP